MKLCNDTITIFSASVDTETGGNVWTPAVITDVSWYKTDESTLDTGRGGLVAAGKVIVRIPETSTPDGFGLKPGDIIVRGDASATASPTPARLKQTYGDGCATVLGVTDNRRAPNAPHWRVTGS